MGQKDTVDLPITMQKSNYFKNIIKRIRSGETPQKAISELENHLNDNKENVWENSWVRFPGTVLSPYAIHVFNRDLLADKNNPTGPQRGDINKFIFCEKGERFLRVPVSYLLKLSLADVISKSPHTHPLVRKTGEQILKHFLNDNTSPETFSFNPVPLNSVFEMGKGLARETSKRFLLTQLLTMYANQSFQLLSTGQRALIYFAPHTPLRQKLLNERISDSFYRELFISPCLSGWEKGEEKYQYMILCHQVLSRSQINTIAKLKEAGIILSNLVVLPNISSTSLANNGTHISLGSRKLTNLLSNAASGFNANDEKYIGDLAIKIVEHFLPLFVGTYSAAPYQFNFWDFHPERVLGFLPHELDYTHLRMIWRRWKKKSKFKFFGQPITPFGPVGLDKLISKLFFLKGDVVPDARLIDYLVALLSTDQSPALDGSIGNTTRFTK